MKYFETVSKRGSSCAAGGGGGSVRSSDTPDELSSPGGCPTPSSSSGDPTEIAFTVGVTENTPYGCQFCDKAFPRLTYLKRHEQIHSDQMPFRCDYCHRLFKHKRSRDRHVKLHTGDRKYRCSQCESAFSRSDHLKIHMRTHDNGKPYQCAVCNRGYNTAAALSSHMQNHKKTTAAAAETQLMAAAAAATNDTVDKEDETDPPKPLLCTLCPQLCSSPTALGEHVMQAHPSLCESPPTGRKACNECASPDDACPHNKTSSDGDAEKSRSPEKGSPAQLRCGFCSKSDFPSFESLQLHVQVLHLPPASLRSLVQQHSASPHTDPFLGYGGLDCSDATGFTSALHFLQKQAFVLKRPHDTYCSQCNLGFSSAAALLDHVHMTHERNTPTTNHHTNKRSLSGSSSRSLRPNGAKQLKSGSHLFNGTSTSSHYRRQDPGGGNAHGGATNPSPTTLLCSQCNAGFSDFESFRTHLKSHLDAAAPSSQQPQRHSFRCPECGAELPTEQQLDSHVTAHYLSASTEYGCQSCLKLFAKPDELQKHLMDVHAYHLYRCALCRQMFDSKVSIQVHFAVKHSNECRSLKCTSCSAYFRTELEFQVHVKLSHLSGKSSSGGYRCLLCDQLFPSELQLQYHASTHQKQFPCGQCGEAFHVEFLLDRHVQAAHQQQGRADGEQGEEAQNLCTKTPQQNRDQQPQSSSDGRPSSAPSPGSPSPSGGRAKEQKTSSSSVVSLFCAYCNESCKSRRELENHMKSHASPSKHKCNICDEICPSATTLAEHKLTHCKVVSGSTCIVCRVQLLSEDQFLSHLHQHGGGGGNLPVPCVVCRQTLLVDVEARMHARFHLRNQSGTSSAPCCVCSGMFDPSHLVIRASQGSVPLTYMCKGCFHSRGEEESNRDPNKVPRCPDCGVKFESGSELESHRRSAHQRSFQCIQCQVSFETEAEIRAHVACHVQQEGTHLECRLCHEVLDSPSKLQCHLIEHTYEGSSHFTCYLCASVFTGSHLLQRHMLEHGLDARPYDCSDCSQKFFFRAELDNHSFVHVWENIKRLHTNNNALHKSGSSSESSSVLYECRKCPGVFANSVDLSKHQVSHQDTCTFCGMEFASKEDLMGHVRLLHSAAMDKGVGHQDLYQFDEDSRDSPSEVAKQSRGFECPFCRKRFPRKEARKLHMKSHHSTTKGYTCNHCDKVCLKRSQLKEHMRTHISSTTQSCEICESAFPSTPLLRRHLRDKHNRRYEHTCVVCDELFDDPKSLLDHQLEQHKVTLSTPSPEQPSTSREVVVCHQRRSSSNESSDTVIDGTEVKPESVDFKEQEEISPLPAEVAA